MIRGAFLRRPGAPLLAGAALVLGLLVLAGIAWVYGKHRWASERLAELEPRYARVLGVVEGEQPLTTAMEQQAQVAARFIYPAELDATQVGNNALQRLHEVLSNAGCQVLSSQVMPARDDVPEFERIPINVRLEADLGALQRGLAQIEAQSPIMITNSVHLQVTQVGAGGAGPVTATLVVSVLRRRP